jgi:hypothetical protein
MAPYELPTRMNLCCNKLTYWRNPNTNSAGDNPNRRKFVKVVCSLLLLLMFGSYCKICYDANSNALVFCGVATMLKFLIEIWGQETATWVCPGMNL